MRRIFFDIHVIFYLECPTFDVSLGHDSLAFLTGPYDLGQLPGGGGLGYIGRGQGYYMTVVRITTSITVRIVARLPNQHNQAVYSKEVKNVQGINCFIVYFQFTSFQTGQTVLSVTSGEVSSFVDGIGIGVQIGTPLNFSSVCQGQYLTCIRNVLSNSCGANETPQSWGSRCHLIKVAIFSMLLVLHLCYFSYF